MAYNYNIGKLLIKRGVSIKSCTVQELSNSYSILTIFVNDNSVEFIIDKIDTQEYRNNNFLTVFFDSVQVYKSKCLNNDYFISISNNNAYKYLLEIMGKDNLFYAITIAKINQMRNSNKLVNFNLTEIKQFFNYCYSRANYKEGLIK